MIMRTKPDVVLLDIVMPGMDGISVMEKVKATKNSKKIHLSSWLRQPAARI